MKKKSKKTSTADRITKNISISTDSHEYIEERSVREKRNYSNMIDKIISDAKEIEELQQNNSN